MAQDTYTIAIKETQFDATGPTPARDIAIDWNALTLITSKTFTTKAVTYHQGASGGVDLVRIVLGSDIGDVTTTQSFFTHMVSKPYAGTVGNTEIAAAIRDLAVATLPNVTGTFSYDRDEDGVKRFRCSTPNDKLIGLYYNGNIAVAQLKATETAPASEDVTDNKAWFSIIGKNKTGQ
jgi:hypothetical protein